MRMVRMFTLMMLVFLAVLAGCAETQPMRVLSIPQGSLVLTEDLALIRAACANVNTTGIILGCYQPQTKTMFCSSSRIYTCGHELLHHVGLRHEEY